MYCNQHFCKLSANQNCFLIATVLTLNGSDLLVNASCDHILQTFLKWISFFILFWIILIQYNFNEIYFFHHFCSKMLYFYSYFHWIKIIIFLIAFWLVKHMLGLGVFYFGLYIVNILFYNLRIVSLKGIINGNPELGLTAKLISVI